MAGTSIPKVVSLRISSVVAFPLVCMSFPSLVASIGLLMVETTIFDPSVSPVAVRTDFHSLIERSITAPMIHIGPMMIPTRALLIRENHEFVVVVVY